MLLLFSTAESVVSIQTKDDAHMIWWLVKGLKIEFELSLSDANVGILTRDSQQPIISKPPAGGGVFKHVRCSDSRNGTCIQFEVSDVIWPFDIELYLDLGKYIYIWSLRIAGTWIKMFSTKMFTILLNELFSSKQLMVYYF